MALLVTSPVPWSDTRGRNSCPGTLCNSAFSPSPGNYLSKKRSRLGQCVCCSLFWRAASTQMKPLPGAVNPCSPPGTAAPAPQQQRRCQMVLGQQRGAPRQARGARHALGLPRGCPALSGRCGGPGLSVSIRVCPCLSLVPSQPGLQPPLPGALVPSAAAGPGLLRELRSMAGNENR